MSDFQHQPGFGAIFINNKNKDSQPDRTGEITAHRDIKAGEVLELAGWAKKDKNGKSYLSLAISDKREATAGAGAGNAASGGPGDDNIDF